MKKLAVLLLLVMFSRAAKADSWLERPDNDFHAHPLQDIRVSSRTFARGEIVKVLRETTRSRRGLVKVMISGGRHAGQTVYAENFFRGSHSFVKDRPGANVIINYLDEKEPVKAVIDGYDRTGPMLLLVILFLASVLAVGGKRIIKPLAALIFGILIIKFLFVPAVLKGYPPSYTVMAVLELLTVLTVLSISGITHRSLASVLGIFAGLGGTLFLSVFFLKKSCVYGFFMEEVQLLNYFSPVFQGKSLSFYADLLAACIVLAGSGVLMDTGVGISSAMDQVVRAGIPPDPARLFKSGINVAADVVSTMINTLVIAFLGISMGSIMVSSLHITSMFQLLNSEFFHFQFYKSVLSAAGFIICALVTVGVFTFLYHKKIDKT
ncbi:MAG: YibE/F family protein [Elusimicrobia bacterium]|nr:YibE/F family protein [Elusimicrobiota bacterium]